MEQQGGSEGFARPEAFMAVAFVSLQDPQFLSGLRTDLESTLWRYGFALSPEEINDVRGHLDVGSDRSDEEILADLQEQPGDDERRWKT